MSPDFVGPSHPDSRKGQTIQENMGFEHDRKDQPENPRPQHASCGENQQEQWTEKIMGPFVAMIFGPQEPKVQPITEHGNSRTRDTENTSNE